MFRQLEDVCQQVAEARKNKRLVITVHGDATEGKHHDSRELISAYLIDQTTIHKEIMLYVMRVTGWDKSKGDALYYLDGTPSHAGEEEYKIAHDLGAVPYEKPTEEGSVDGQYTFPVITKTIHGTLVYMAHHGPHAGAEAMRGDALRRNLRKLAFRCNAHKQRVPRIVIYADKHDHWHETYTHADGSVIDGFIMPSWKLKDGFLYKFDPFAFSNIGAFMMTVHTDGTFEYKFMTTHIIQERVDEL